jgi:hypothetical protein
LHGNGLEEGGAAADAGEGVEVQKDEREGEELGEEGDEAVAFAEHEGGAQNGPREAAIPDDLFRFPLGLVIAGTGVGTGAEGTHLKVTADAGGFGGSGEGAGGFDMGLLESIGADLGNQADEIDHGLGSSAGFGEQGWIGKITSKDFDPMAFDQRGGFLRVAHEDTDMVAGVSKLSDDFLTDKTGRASDEDSSHSGKRLSGF